MRIKRKGSRIGVRWDPKRRNIELCRGHWYRRVQKRGIGREAETAKRSQCRLRSCIKEDARAGTNDHFSAGFIPGRPGYSKTRAEVMPTRVPERSTTGSKLQGGGLADVPQHRV